MRGLGGGAGGERGEVELARGEPSTCEGLRAILRARVSSCDTWGIGCDLARCGLWSVPYIRLRHYLAPSEPGAEKPA